LPDKGWLFLNKPVMPKDTIQKIEGILERLPSPEVDRGPESRHETTTAAGLIRSAPAGGGESGKRIRASEVRL
jgi:hypothetical protein